jgi:hypothetical protein
VNGLAMKDVRRKYVTAVWRMAGASGVMKAAS